MSARDLGTDFANAKTTEQINWKLLTIDTPSQDDGEAGEQIDRKMRNPHIMTRTR